MRSVFTINLPRTLKDNEKEKKEKGSYYDNQTILKLIRSFGWELAEIQDLSDENTKHAKYREKAEALFDVMPELQASTEKGSVIYYGYLADDRTKFIITRMVEGQITFRLLNPILSSLMSSTEKIIKEIIKHNLWNHSLIRGNQNIVVYERSHEDIILSGRVIPNPLPETFRSNRKDSILTIIPFIIFLLSYSLISFNVIANNAFLTGTLERLSTALLTTSIVSLLGLVQTYTEIKTRVINWTFTSPST